MMGSRELMILPQMARMDAASGRVLDVLLQWAFFRPTLSLLITFSYGYNMTLKTVSYKSRLLVYFFKFTPQG
jgi:hypothetical protein